VGAGSGLEERRDVTAEETSSADDVQETEPEVAVELDSTGQSVGVERETIDEEVIEEPFDPEQIDVVTRTPTVDLLLARIRRGVLDLQPDFQRFAGIWTEQNQSRLIESMLLRIPLPTFYAAETDDETWVTVDGIQRLTAIARFVAPASIAARPLVLTKLDYLRQYEGKRFAELPGRLQTRLVETELVLHLIRRGTPEPVMFNIFARINTGGRPLTRQELRHALIPGPARDVLRELAGSQAYQKATLRSVSPERMDDREMVLRFIAFRLTDPEQYRPDIDEFLRKAMHEMNQLPAEQIMTLRHEFSRAMDAAREIFGEHAFRKRYPGQTRRSPINKALFETISVNLAGRSDRELSRLLNRRDQLAAVLSNRLKESPDFDRAISVGTGDAAKVRLRFSVIDRLLKDVSHA
jgi:hypothetical protein